MNNLPYAQQNDHFYSIVYGLWSLEISNELPGQFLLLYNSIAIFKGSLKIIRNNEQLDTESIVWRFRVKSDQIEQWCNLNSDKTISISMIYAFNHKALTIDYLARSNVPTRMDILHSIEQLELEPPLDIEGNHLISLSEWEHEINDQPSDHLATGYSKEFKEAFLSTQKIVIG